MAQTHFKVKDRKRISKAVMLRSEAIGGILSALAVLYQGAIVDERQTEAIKIIQEDILPQAINEIPLEEARARAVAEITSSLLKIKSGIPLEEREDILSYVEHHIIEVLDEDFRSFACVH